MSIQEYIEGSGVYIVPLKELPPCVLFIRDPKGSTTNEMGPLLHICKKEIDPAIAEPTLVLETARVTWDFYYGFYLCTGCKKTWDRDDEDGLRAIWSDGYGTGDEGQA